MTELFMVVFVYFSKYVEVVHLIRSFIYAFACVFGIIVVEETNDVSHIYEGSDSKYCCTERTV